MQYYYIEYETRGGVDVIPLLTVFEKRVFRDSVPFLQKTSIFRGEISGNFPGSGSQRRLNFHFFFFSVFALQQDLKKSSLLKSVSKLPKTALFWPKFPGISGNFGISGKFPPDFPPDFPRISPRGTPVSRADPRKNRGNFPPKFRGFSGGFPGAFPDGFWTKKCRKSSIFIDFYTYQQLAAARFYTISRIFTNLSVEKINFPGIFPESFPGNFPVGNFPDIFWKFPEIFLGKFTVEKFS